jgi:hypothetical protein
MFVWATPLKFRNAPLQEFPFKLFGAEEIVITSILFVKQPPPKTDLLLGQVPISKVVNPEANQKGLLTSSTIFHTAYRA